MNLPTSASPPLGTVAVVLVAPQGALNVGSVCRAMRNFGTDDLRLVNPCEDYQATDARRMALKAQPLLQTARCYADLDAALADRHLVIGATARQGKYRDACLTPRQMGDRVADLADDVRVALVLGREDSGLKREEIERCNTLVTIPTDPGYAALNLAQAAGLLLYELFLARVDRPDRPPMDPLAERLADQRQLEQLYTHLQATLTRSGFLPADNPAHLMRTLRRLFGRTELETREVQILRGILSSVDALLK
ncbi:MAG: RNA methyltransferase [Desulfosarcinaceae bacterium]|nr:RNA methyltransferase [Desulfosarcinaceae bacterium]